MTRTERPPNAAEIAERIRKAAEKYTNRWSRSAQPEFNRAAWLVMRHVNRILTVCENAPEEIAEAWAWVMDARDIEIVHRVLMEAKEAEGGDD